MRTLFSFIPRLWANWITLLGSIITTLSAGSILVLGLVEWSGEGGNPYLAGFLYMFLPAIFVLGLLIIPIGFWVDRRGRLKAQAKGVEHPGSALERAFMVAVSDPIAKRRILFVSVLTFVNVALLAVGGNQAVHYMDSPKFCGATCHTVMQPEYTTYQGSKHSRVDCVECHIGPGASWMVKSKINGMRQVLGVMTGNYSRPIPSPVEHLRPSRDTCEKCHWPEKFAGNLIRVYPHFTDDKDNTPVYNVAALRVGGRNKKTGKYEGIHWHVSDNEQVKYEVLDQKRSKVGKITVLENGKVVAEYLPPKEDAGLKVLSERTMDCVDCHNRPTHVYDYSARAAVDRLMHAGLLDQTVPFLVKFSAETLSVDMPRADAEKTIRKALGDKYQAAAEVETKPDAKVLDDAAKVLAEAYLRNVYPEMKISWGTYTSNLGHGGKDPVGKPGCFRCHDKEHEKKLPDGSTKTLSQDCEQCHEVILADEDINKVEDELKQLIPH